MSVGKKRVSVVPESVATNTNYPVYDLDQAIGGIQAGVPAGAATDPLAALEAEETVNAIKELRELQMQKKRAQLLNRVKKEKEEIEMSQQEDGSWAAAKGLPNLSLDEMSKISKMPPEEQQRLIQAYQLVGSLQAYKMPGGQANPLLTMMMATGGLGGGARQGMTTNDVLQIAQMFNGIYNGAGRGDTDVTKQLLLNLMSNTLPQWQNSAIQNMQMAYQAQIQQLQQNQADPLRDLEYGKKLAESLGFKPSSVSADIEKVRIEMEDRWKLKEFELKANQIQYERNLGLVNQILNNPMVAELARLITRGIPPAAAAAAQVPSVNQLSQQQAVTQPQGPTTPGSLVKYICPNPQCGADIIAPITQTSVTCTQCGGTYAVDPKATLDRVSHGGAPQ